MLYTIINDCRDANAAGRQATRVAALTGVTPVFVGVGSDLEAAGNLIDMLDAALGAPGAILVNVAPRSGSAKKWKNGTPFGYFQIGKTVVVASVDGLTLSLVKKLGLVREIRLLDVGSATEEMVERGALQPALREHIVGTQFRSLEFLPRVAAYLIEHGNITDTPFSAAKIPDAPRVAWFIDNFGNVKTTLLPEELPAPADNIQTRFGRLPFYEHLAEVPDGTAALIRGSSGLGSTRFVELIIQGGNAAQKFGIVSGDDIL